MWEKVSLPNSLVWVSFFPLLYECRDKSLSNQKDLPVQQSFVHVDVVR